MKNKKKTLICIVIISLIYMIVDKFILISNDNRLEIITFIGCIILLIFSSIKLYQLSHLSKGIKIVLQIITILMILWVSIVGTDYKRVRNMRQPIFTLSRNLLTADGIDVNNGLGYQIIQEYKTDTEGRRYLKKSTFYLFHIKIDEINIAYQKANNEKK